MRGIHETSTKMTPDKFYSDMMNLATQSPRDAADVAGTWRNRFLNMAEGGQTAVKKGLGVGVGATVGFTFGILGGRWDAEDDDIQEDWINGGYAAAGLAKAEDGSPYREGHAKDEKRYPGWKPGTVFGVPMTLLATLVLGAMAIFNVGGEEWNSLIAAGAFSGTVYWTAQIGTKVGYDWKMDAIKKAEEEAANQAAA
jgi:hypothetical protein